MILKIATVALVAISAAACRDEGQLSYGVNGAPSSYNSERPTSTYNLNRDRDVKAFWDSRQSNGE